MSKKMGRRDKERGTETEESEKKIISATVSIEDFEGRSNEYK